MTKSKGRGLQAWSMAELSPAFLAQIMLIAACFPVLGWEMFQGYYSQKKNLNNKRMY